MGHFLSLNTFQITKKFPHPLRFPLAHPRSQYFLIPYVVVFITLLCYHWALARLLQRRCIPSDCTKHSWENGWQFQNLVTIARMSTSHIHAPFPPLPPLQLADLSHPLLAYRTARTVWFWLMPLSMSGLVPLCLRLPLPPPPQAAQVFGHTKLQIEKVVKTSNFARFSNSLFFRLFNFSLL